MTKLSPPSGEVLSSKASTSERSLPPKAPSTSRDVAVPPHPGGLRAKRTMLAAIIAAPGKVQLAEVPLPEPGPGQVRVRLEGCGVCGSNLAPWEGRPWFKYPLAPGELGHEGWGRVDALGAGSQRFKEGDRVALLSYRAYAQYDIASENAVVRLPGSMDGKPVPGEALGCAMNVFRRCDIDPGHTVAVVGIGFLGAVLAGLASRAGARVIAISRRPFALHIARQLGAGETIPLEDHAGIVARVRDLTGGAGCDRVIEAVGQQSPLDLAAELTRERGRLIIAGYHQDGSRSVNMQLWNWRGLDVISAHERNPEVYRAGIEFAVDTISSGRLDPSPLYTHAFELTDLSLALKAMRDRPDKFLKAWVKI